MEPQNPDAGTLATPVPTGAPMLSAQPQTVAQPQTMPGTVGQALAIPAVAEDNDIIENEWIDAVRNAVKAYQGDPYNLNVAIAMLRQEYLSKRYGRDAKAE